MLALLWRSESLVWLLLMLATVLTTWLLAKDAFPAHVSTIGIFLIAALKVRMVLLHFMELGHAPWPVRLVFESWVMLVSFGVIGIYLTT